MFTNEASARQTIKSPIEKIGRKARMATITTIKINHQYVSIVTASNFKVSKGLLQKEGKTDLSIREVRNDPTLSAMAALGKWLTAERKLSTKVKQQFLSEVMTWHEKSPKQEQEPQKNRLAG